MGTFVLLPISNSAVLVLSFTAELLLPLVHLLHQAPSYTGQHRRNSFRWCVANQAQACSPSPCVHMSRHGQSATQGNPQKQGAWKGVQARELQFRIPKQVVEMSRNGWVRLWLEHFFPGMLPEVQCLLAI